MTFDAILNHAVPLRKLFFVNSFCTSLNDDPVLMYKKLSVFTDIAGPKNFQVTNPTARIRMAIMLSMIFFFIVIDNKINKKPRRSDRE
jgi:hypothetical protein